jgi:hypothetical protein
LTREGCDATREGGDAIREGRDGGTRATAQLAGAAAR